MSFEYTVRNYQDGDESLIYASWIKTAWSYELQRAKACKSIGPSLMNKDLFCQEQHALIERLLKRCKILIACNQQFEDQIYGYIVYEVIDKTLVLHFIYIRFDFRQFGIASKLLSLANNIKTDDRVYTQPTPAWKHLVSKWGVVFNPFGARL